LQRIEGGRVGFVRGGSLREQLLRAEAQAVAAGSDVGLQALEIAALVAQSALLLGNPVAAERQFIVDIAQHPQRLQVALRALLSGFGREVVALRSKLELALGQRQHFLALVKDRSFTAVHGELKLFELVLFQLDQARVPHLSRQEHRADLRTGEVVLHQFSVRLRFGQSLAIQQRPGLAQTPGLMRSLGRHQGVHFGIDRQAGFESVEQRKKTGCLSSSLATPLGNG